MDDTGKMATSIIAEISCPESPYLVGGPGLMSLDEQKGGLVEILNTGPEPVTLARGQVIGQADNVANQSLVPFGAQMVNRMVEEQWKKKQGSSMRTTVTEEFRQMCPLEVPSQHEADYLQLLAKHRGIFSLNKNRVVQDFRSLNANTYVDKYSMKDVQECISEIGWTGSRIVMTLDLTSGFWQMALDLKLRPYTAFTVPGMGQF
jgi:hypothetical protein